MKILSYAQNQKSYIEKYSFSGFNLFNFCLLIGPILIGIIAVLIQAVLMF